MAHRITANCLDPFHSECLPPWITMISNFSILEETVKIDGQKISFVISTKNGEVQVSEKSWVVLDEHQELVIMLDDYFKDVFRKLGDVRG